MKNLIQSANKIGQEHPDLCIDDLMPTLNRRTFTAQLIIQGKQLFKEKFKIFQKIGYVSLAIDAGKIGSVNY